MLCCKNVPHLHLSFFCSFLNPVEQCHSSSALKNCGSMNKSMVISPKQGAETAVHADGPDHCTDWNPTDFGEILCLCTTFIACLSWLLRYSMKLIWVFLTSLLEEMPTHFSFLCTGTGTRDIRLCLRSHSSVHPLWCRLSHSREHQPVSVPLTSDPSPSWMLGHW